MKLVSARGAPLLALVALAALVVLAALPACTPPATQPEASEIARVHRAKCGTCHLRVEPGQRSRDELVVALAPHRKRVRLTEDQWSAMVDYLAIAPGQPAAKSP